MATTIEELKEKLARVQQELAEVSAALDELAAPETKSVTRPVANRTSARRRGG